MVLAPRISSAIAPRAAETRVSFARIPEVLPMPNLVDIQRHSFQWFLREGLGELFDEISPIQDFTSKNMDLELAVPGPNGEPGYSFGEPKYSEEECREADSTYAAPLRVRMRLTIKGEIGEIKEMEIFMGDFPMMTTNGTFIINGAERVVVSQLVRSPGVYFTLNEDATSGRALCMGKLIPSRGAWLEFESSNKDVLSVKVDRKRKIPLTTLLRAVAAVSPVPALTKSSSSSSRRSTTIPIITTSRQRSTATPPRTRTKPSSTSTAGCGRATRRPSITRSRCSAPCCSTTVAMTWAALGATRSTGGWTSRRRSRSESSRRTT